MASERAGPSAGRADEESAADPSPGNDSPWSGVATNRVLFETRAIGVAITDDQRRFVDCNRAFAEMLGYGEPAELVGASAAELTYPQDTPADQLLAERLRSGQLSESAVEKQYRRRDGSPVWVRVRLAPIPGRRLSFCFFEDISQRKQAELELHEATGELLAAQELGRVGSWVWYPHENRNKRSEHTRRIMRLGPQDWHSDDPDLFLDKLEADDRARALRLFDAAFSGAQRLEDEYRVVQDGQEHWFRVQGDVELDAAGEPWRMVGVLIDVTDSKRVERELRDAASYLERVERVAGVGTWAWDRDTGALELSDGTRRLFGIEVGSRPSRADVEALVHPDDRDRVVAAAREALATTQEFAVEFRRPPGEGEGRWLRLQGGAERGEDGRASRLLGAVLDITESRRAEAGREALAEQLRRVQQLDALGKLAGGIAHDFNNTLMVIAGTAQLGLLRTEDATLREGLAEIQRAAERASELTRQLLVFSRRQPLTTELLDLNELVRASRARLGGLLGSSVELHEALATEPLVVFADRAQLEQVLVNLALNAREAMPAGGQLTIGTARQGDAGARQAILTVRDTGIGVRAENIGRVFEPFFTTKESEKSAGLGLAAAYGAIEAAGGAITISSEPDAGTVLTITLPLRGPVGERVEPATRPARRGGGVLLVDDDAQVRRTMASMLAAAGYAPVTATSDPEGALAIATDGTAFEVLVSDLVMTQMSGVELARRLRELRPGLPVLFVSGYPGDVLGEDETGPATAFLAKPCSVAMLQASLRQLFGGLAER